MAAKRTPISGPRQTGVIVDWKGAFGWIKPNSEIKHPLAHKHQGKVYLGQDDVVEELDGIGANVSFTLYSDKSGLGAGDCKMAKTAAPKGAMKGKPAATSNAAATAKGANTPAAKAAANGKVAGKGAKNVTQTAAGKGAKTVAQTTTGKGATNLVKQTAFQKKPTQPDHAAGKGKSKGKAKGGKGGDPGQREILHEEPLLGTITQWRGKFGWIKPHDTIEHPLAHKHQGDLYLEQGDVEDEIDGVGATVQFILYGDRKGLGAQNVRPA